MRLIDADKLRIKCHTVNDLQPDKFVVSRMMVPSEVIDAEPTVKAIPIEWFEKRMKEINEAMTRLYVEGCYYPKSDEYEKRRNILLRRLAEIKLQGSAYDLVLNEWRVEKENDKMS